MNTFLTLMKRTLMQSVGIVRVGVALGIWLFFGVAAPAAQSPVTQVILVFKTHFDIGYTDLASNVVQRYRTTMIDDALRVVELNRDLPSEQQFAWTLPGWPMHKISEDWPGQTPERKARILAALKTGRFAVHALPFTTHTELLELEDLVRGLGFASRLSRAVGLELPRDAKMTDVPCHSWILPTLLKRAGVDFLHLGCNAASSSPQVPRLFLWEGPDGSRLLTMYIAEGYGTGLLPPADWPHKTWLALIHTGDNHGPPRPDEVKQLLDEAKQKLPGATARIGRLSDFADAVLAEKAEIPIVRGDMPDTWIHGPMCDPAGARLARHVRPVITMMESFNTLSRAWGHEAPDIADIIARAYEQSLLYGEHTWGGALYWVTRYGGGTKWGYGETWKADHTANRFQRLEASWAEHTAYIENARNLMLPLQAQQLAVLRAVGPPKNSRRTNRDRDPWSLKPVVVYNPLPWWREDLVRAEYGPGKMALLALNSRGDRGSSPAERIANEIRFVAQSVPPMGYGVFKMQLPVSVPAPRVDKTNFTMTTHMFKAVLDPTRGAIRSLVHIPSRRELVDSSADHGFGQFLYERFDSNQVAGFVRDYVKINADWALNELGKPSLPPANQASYRAASPRNCAISFQESILSATASMHSEPSLDLPLAVTTRLTLYMNYPYADLEVELRGKPADPWPEAGWLCLPFKMESPQFRLGRLGSIIDPVKDIVRGANRHLFGINTGVALFDANGAGVGMCPLDNPLVSLDTPGCWKYSLDFVPKRPAVYVNLFNNQWTTNFRLWNEGAWTFRVRIWCFDQYDPESSLITPSLEARYPLRAAVLEGDESHLPKEVAGLSLSRKGILVTAFGPNPDGPGTLLRLWEMAGRSTPSCEVQLPSGMTPASIQPVNLRGQPQGAPIAVAQGRFHFDCTAFAPASFLLPP